MRVDRFDYELPEHLIAQRPVEPRDASRLLVVHRDSGRLEHRAFRDLEEYLARGDCLALNDTKVAPARLYGTRSRTGGRWEGLFLRQRGDNWEMMTKTRGKPEPGETVVIEGAHGALELELLERTGQGRWLVRPAGDDTVDPFETLARFGHVPLPPYIRGGQDEGADRESYQTVFARAPGAVAAPTAGLHFTNELLARLSDAGVRQARLTLHVGPGTFQPVTVQDSADHQMHAEWCELSEAAAVMLNEAKRDGNRRVAVGTTSVRTLESAAIAAKTTAALRTGESPPDIFELIPFQGETKLFITPGFEFLATDAILTNFHLPKSTLIMLACAFGGTELILDAYREAVRRRYRFYSYGDAMLIL